MDNPEKTGNIGEGEGKQNRKTTPCVLDTTYVC
jgi:hypothetical protein